jgi:hypothetical protein
MRFLWRGLRAKDFSYVELIFRCEVSDFMMLNLKDKLLFIRFKNFKKWNIPFKVVKLWFIFEKFLRWENGVLEK